MDTPIPSPRTWKLWERPATPPPLQLQPRDVHILEQVVRYRYLKPSYLAVLLGSSEAKIARRCRLLWANQYLERPAALRPSKILMDELVYGPGPRGLELLAHLRPELRTGTLEWYETPQKRRTYPYLDHQLMVARILICLELACQQRGLTLHWTGHVNRQAWRIVPPGDQSATLPDAYFAIEVPGKGLVHHFLEADRGNISLARLRDRYEKYFRFWKDGQAERRFKHFRVLTIVQDDGYLSSVRRVGQSIGRDDAHPRAWKALLFSRLEAFDAARPEQALEPIWFYADEEGPVSLVPNP